MVSRGSTPTALFVNVPLLSIGREPRAAGEISLGEGTLPETLPDIQANLSAVSFWQLAAAFCYGRWMQAMQAMQAMQVEVLLIHVDPLAPALGRGMFA